MDAAIVRSSLGLFVVGFVTENPSNMSITAVCMPPAVYLTSPKSICYSTINSASYASTLPPRRKSLISYSISIADSYPYIPMEVVVLQGSLSTNGTMAFISLEITPPWSRNYCSLFCLTSALYSELVGLVQYLAMGWLSKPTSIYKQI